MAIQSRVQLKSWFETGDKPIQDQFHDWIDSFFHLTEDSSILDSYVTTTVLNSTLLDYVEIVDIIDNLISTDTDKPLSANQGKVLKALIAVSENILTFEDGLTRSGDTIKLGGDFTENIVISSTTANRKLEIIVGLFSGANGYFSELEINSLGSLLSNTFYQNHPNFSVQRTANLFMGDGQCILEYYDTEVNDGCAIVLNNFVDIVFKKYTEGYTFKGAKYDEDNSSRWGTINISNLYIPHLGYIISNFSDISHTHLEADITDLQAYILDITSEPLSDLIDVTITSIATGELIAWTGTNWINVTKTEAGISAVGHTHVEIDITDLGVYLEDITAESIFDLSDVNNISITTGEILQWGGTSWINNTLEEAGISETFHSHTATDVSDFDTEVSNNVNVTNNTVKITNATHTGDVTGSTALTIAVDAVDIAMLSATGTPDNSTYLRGDNTWSTPGGLVSQSSNTWTVASPAGRPTLTSTLGRYVKTGELVFLEFRFTVPANSDGLQVIIDSIPFNSVDTSFAIGVAQCINGSTYETHNLKITGNETQIQFHDFDNLNNPWSWQDAAGFVVVCSITYISDEF